MEEAKITLKAARTIAGLTQRELADKLGISRVTVQAWEAGKSIPRFDQAKKICELAHISLDVLFVPSIT